MADAHLILEKGGDHAVRASSIAQALTARHTIATMRVRRIGNSELQVSEVGFGTWTLVSDWWGRTDDPHKMIEAALDAGINFIDTAPVYGVGGAGETILADYLARATTSCSRRKSATTSLRSGSFLASPSVRTTGARSPSAAKSRTRCAASAPIASISSSCTTRGSSRSSTTRCGRRSKHSVPRARCASSASRSGPRSAGSKKETVRSTNDRSCHCRRCSTCSSRSPA